MIHPVPPFADFSTARTRLASASRSLGYSANNLGPQSSRLGVIAALVGKARQVAPGQMTVDRLVEAAELIGTV
jgi:hypothetical protein